MARRNRSVVKAANEAAKVALKACAATPGDPDSLGSLSWTNPVSGWKRDAVEVRQIFADHGFEPGAVLPEIPDQFLAFGRAIQSCGASLRARGIDIEFKDAAPGPNNERRVAVVELARNGLVSTTDTATVTCARDGTAPYIERAGHTGADVELLVTQAALVGIYTSSDIRNAVTTMYTRFHSLPCRQSPPHVVYWVPPAADSQIRNLADAVEACGWGRLELFAGYVSDERSKRAVTDTVNEGLEARLREFKERCDTFLGANKVRSASLEKAILEAADLRQQAELYRSVLGAACLSVDDRVSEIEKTLRDALNPASDSECVATTTATP